MNLKQLFCKHIWKPTEDEVLGKTKYIYLGVHWYTDVRYARYSYCIKCGKANVTEMTRREY